MMSRAPGHSAASLYPHPPSQVKSNADVRKSAPQSGSGGIASSLSSATGDALLDMAMECGVDQLPLWSDPIANDEAEHTRGRNTTSSEPLTIARRVLDELENEGWSDDADKWGELEPEPIPAPAPPSPQLQRRHTHQQSVPYANTSAASLPCSPLSLGCSLFDSAFGSAGALSGLAPPMMPTQDYASYQQLQHQQRYEQQQQLSPISLCATRATSLLRAPLLPAPPLDTIYSTAPDASTAQLYMLMQQQQQKQREQLQIHHEQQQQHLLASQMLVHSASLSPAARVPAPPTVSSDVASAAPPENEKKRPAEEDLDAPSKSRFREYQSSQWTDRFQDLLVYKKEKGHCNVPHTYEDNPVLARWVKRQRYQYKLWKTGAASTMTDARHEQLNEIGFLWDSHKAAWHERWIELCAFRREHGHCNVPSEYAANPQLATWVKCQRRQYKLLHAKTGVPSNMTPDRIQKLEGLGFEWELRSSRKRK